jgi:hypothetical protein
VLYRQSRAAFLYLDGTRYDRDHGITAEQFVLKTSVQRKKAQNHDGASVYYEAVWSALLAHPEYFHQPNTKKP